MKKINSIEELTEGQEVYISFKTHKTNDENYPLFIICNGGEYPLSASLTHDFKQFRELEQSQLQLFTAEPVGNSEQLVLPEIGKEYEFSDNGKHWTKGPFYGYRTDYNQWKYIRPIQQSQEELKAIEYLESLGYRIHK